MKRKAGAEKKQFMRPATVEAIYDISASSLAQMRYRGEGPAFYKPNGPDGRTVLYKVSDIEAWIESGLRHAVS